MDIALTKEAADKLRALLKNDSADYRIRMREVKVGTACKAHMEIRLSIDEPEDDDLPFTIDPEVIAIYGENFSTALDEKQFPVVTARN